MSDSLSQSARKVQDALREHGFAYQVKELSQATRSAREAAEAVGCGIGQIAKSLIFKSKNKDEPLLVITSGSNRVNEERISEYISEPVEKADPDFVREKTGFSIGGVPPIGHLEKIMTFIDEDLLRYEQIWAAAGNPRAVFKLQPEELVEMTGGQVVSVK